MMRFLHFLPLLTLLACSASGEEQNPASPETPAEATPAEKTPNGHDGPAQKQDQDDVKPSTSGGGAPALPPIEPANALPKVCAGQQGTGAGLSVVSWSIYPAEKYKVPLGAGLEERDLTSEPTMMSWSGKPNLSGSAYLDTATMSDGSGTATEGGFSEAALPPTSLGARELGFTSLGKTIFNLTTKWGSAKASTTTSFVPYASATHAYRYMRLDRPKVEPNPTFGDRPYYVTSIHPTVGMSWVFAVHFDVDCKAHALQDLVRGTLWKPTNGVTRKDIERFLVANQATFKLGVVQTGPQNEEIKAVLKDSKCAPSDLAACETTMTALDAARRNLMSAPFAENDYAKLVSEGHVGPWIIGQLVAEPATRF